MGSTYYVTHGTRNMPKSPMQSEKKKATAVPVYSFTWFDVAIVFVSIGTYLADIITDILVTLVYWKLDEKIWAILTLLFLVVPSSIMQIFSTRWYLADGHKASPSLFLIHAIMMGPIKRYIEVLNHGIRARRTKRIEDYQAMYSELSDVSMLRLFESFLESAPQLVLQLYIIIKVTEDGHILTGIAAFFSLISLAWAIAAYTKALRTAAYSQDSRKKRVSYSGLALQTLWRVGMVAGRIIALVLCATIYPLWVLVGVGLHWFVMTLWLVIQDTDFCATWWEERLFNAVVGVIHIFCFFNMKEGRSRWRMVSFYAVTFVENSVMILLWYPHRTEGIWYNVPAMCTVWGGFFVGFTAMVLYYRYFHPSSPKKCHCCMLYYHILYKCCPCHDVTLFHGTPYRRKVNADETSSEFEYGNSNSRCEQHVICRIDGDDDSDSSDMDESRLIMLRPRLTSTPGNDLNDKYENFIERSLEILDESVSEDATFTKSLNVDCINPDDKPCDRDDATKNALILKSLPGGQTGPCANRGNSTLVREWVKKTQDLYCPKEETVVNVNSGKAVSDFGTLRHATKDEREFMQMHFGNFDEKPTGRRDLLRLKSFSKKDRQQSSTATEQRPETNNVSTLRNTFREAFGFHTVESNAAEKRGEIKKIIKKQPKRRIRKKSNLWTVVDIDGENPEPGVDCKTSNPIPNMTNGMSINKISARLDQPPESSHGGDLPKNALRLTARNKIGKELRSSRSRGRAHNMKKYEGRQISQNSKRQSRCKVMTNIEDPGSETRRSHENVVPFNNENMAAVDEALQSIQDNDDIPYVDSSETNDAQNIAHADRCREKVSAYIHESEMVVPQTSDNQICKSDPTTSKEKRISKLCSEYFGPIIQIKGKTVTVKHRDDEQLEIPPTEPTDSDPVSKTTVDNDIYQTNTNICDTGDGLEVYPQQNAALRNEEPISTLEPHIEAKRRNVATLQVFKPSIIRNNIAQTLATEGRCEPTLARKPQEVNRRRMSKYSAHKSEESNARKKLSFMKTSKSYDVSNPKHVQTDVMNSFKASFIVTEDDPVKENHSVKSGDGLSCSMERMLDGTDNYKIHLKDTDYVKKERLSPNKSKKTVNRKMRSKRRTLGAIENI